MIRVGDKVTVFIPREDWDKCGSKEMLKLNNRKFKVNMIKNPKGTAHLYYELQGVKSRAGIPFAFIKEWILPKEAE